jgi:hypothetical protein
MLRRLLPGFLILVAAVLLSACQTAHAAGSSPEPTATPEVLGSINGWVWHEPCPTSARPTGPEKETSGCAQKDDYSRTTGIKARLSVGPCSVLGLTMAETQVTDLRYSFTGLKAGTYCVSIDPFAGPGLSKLQNEWWPSRLGGMIYTTVDLAPGEDKFDVNFSWKYMD